MSGDGVGRGVLMAGFARAAGLALPYAAVVVSRALDCLYILQLERYKPDRFRAWVVSHRRTLVPGRECALQALTVATVAALAITGWHWLGLAIVWLLTGHIILSRHRSLQVSQRLQWTARAARVAVLALGIGGFLVAWAADTAGTYSGVADGVITWQAASPVWPSWPRTTVVGLAARAVAPLERIIARRFLAEASRRMRAYRGRVLGITGSYGKTSTKYVVADLLAVRYRVLKTPAGVNTTMGITRVIREELKEDHEVFVVEMSAYGPGEIREVCDIVHPSLGILTAVGVQHLERFGTPERIAEAKYELIAALPAEAPAVINADDGVSGWRTRTDGGEGICRRGVGARSGRAGTKSRSPRGGHLGVTADGRQVFDTKLRGAGISQPAASRRGWGSSA
jgi:UDP-N-acetylmuramoyl-tripeptide--D-alanyl-D-alanine ligase